jgi:hypothetical protein
MGGHLEGSTVCQTCLAKGLLLCNQECLVKWLAAAQLLHIYFNLPSMWNGKKVLDTVHAQVSGLFGSEVQLA